MGAFFQSIAKREVLLFEVCCTVTAACGLIIHAQPTFIFGEPVVLEHRVVTKGQHISRQLTVVVCTIAAALSGLIPVVVGGIPRHTVHGQSLSLSHGIWSIVAAFTLSAFSWREASWQWLPLTRENWLPYTGLLLLGALSSAAVALYHIGMARESPPTAMMLRYTEIVWVYAWQICIFHELPSFITLVGAGLAVFST